MLAHFISMLYLSNLMCLHQHYLIFGDFLDIISSTSKGSKSDGSFELLFRETIRFAGILLFDSMFNALTFLSPYSVCR